MWFKIHLKHWGNGFATESVNLCLDFDFKILKLHRVHACCAVDNSASIKVLEKVGMIREGRGKQVLPLKKAWSDSYEYAFPETDDRK